MYSLTTKDMFAMPTCLNYVSTAGNTRRARWSCLPSITSIHITNSHWTKMAQYHLITTRSKFWARITRRSQYCLSKKMTRINLYSKTIIQEDEHSKIFIILKISHLTENFLSYFINLNKFFYLFNKRKF